MSQAKQNRFEKKAKNILKYLKSDIRYDQNFLPRPFFIEITGSPASGKTTTITELDKFFRRMGFRVYRPQEGAEVIRHVSRSTPLYNIRTGLYALEMLIDLSNSHKYDLVIFDRSIFDTYAWMMYWHDKGHIPESHKKYNQNFFLQDFWANNIDAVYFMVCGVEETMRRELRIALSDKLGETTNPETVKKLVDRYKRAYEELSPKYKQLLLIDTAKMNEKEMVEYVASMTLDTLEKRAIERRK